MTFSPDSWMLYEAYSKPAELIYVETMYHLSGAQVMGTSYLKVFRFSLKQLGAAIDMNMIRIQYAAFQKLLDEVPPAACNSSFKPPRCPIRGRWIWTLKVFTDYVKPGACRTIHFSSTSLTEMVFVFR